MGCSSSMDTNSVQDEPRANDNYYNNDSNNPQIRWQQQNSLAANDALSVVQEFIRLDERISKLESTCPGARMATVEAWVEHLQSKLNNLLGVDGMQLEHYLAGGPSLGLNRTTSPVDDVPQILSYNNNVDLVESAPKENSKYPVQYVNGNAGIPKLPNGGIIQGPLVRSQQSPTERTASTREISKTIMANTPNKDLANLALNLGVIGDIQKASTHEDFFANLSESGLHLTTIRLYNEILEHTRVRLKMLTEGYTELNQFYVNSDGIIAFISGGTYMSRIEENLDGQLETARDIRDKLGSALEQWRICGNLLHTSSTAATQALQIWRQLEKLIHPKDKIQTALECRNSLQASVISLDCAQMSLPHVEIKHVSNRQILAVQHCNTYMITDIANLSRYMHTSKVIAAYESNIGKASMWLSETFKNTLRKDFEEADKSVQRLAKTLRNHREEIFTAARSK